MSQQPGDATCTQGCVPAIPDNCQASMVVRCPLGYWDVERSESARDQRADEAAFWAEHDEGDVGVSDRAEKIRDTPQGGHRG